MAATVSEIAVQLAAEIANGVDPKDSMVPDTAENRSLRNSLKAEIDEMKSRGIGVNLPTDWQTIPKTLPAKVMPKGKKKAKAEKSVDLAASIASLTNDIADLMNQISTIEQVTKGDLP